MLPSSINSLSSAGNSGRLSDGSLIDGEDIFMTIDTDSGTEFFAVERPTAFDKIESMQSEKQISVDPISLQGSSTIRQASFRLVSPPLKGPGFNTPVASPPPKLKIVSGSLPGSAGSSPSSKGNKNGKVSSQHGKSNLSRMQSAMDDTHLAMRETESRRSKSLGEARTSNTVDDFELWLEKSKDDDPKRSVNTKTTNPLSRQNLSRMFSNKPPLGPSRENLMHNQMRKSKIRDQDFPEDGFKCGKLCLFLPRKGKPVRSSSSASTHISSQMSQISRLTEPAAISRTVSLERFECGPWSPSKEKENENENAEGDSPNLFFDLPLELLRCSVSDMQSPVTAAFVFDDENDEARNRLTAMENNERTSVSKGTLKEGRRKSQDSMRQVRFSTSSPVSYPSSPTSSKPKDEFEAFLEAQAI